MSCTLLANLSFPDVRNYQMYLQVRSVPTNRLRAWH